jgi:hypothetical protein
MNVLVFSKTGGYRHDSIPTGIEAIKRICGVRGWNAVCTEDSRVFREDSLQAFDVAVFLCTTGDVLNDAQQSAFERFVFRGGGYVGVHSASDTEYDWPWYGRLVGAYFASHPAIQEGVLHIEDASHPTTRHLPNPWKRTDEWYDFRSNPRSNVKVLMALDEASYKGGKMGADHPITWWRDFGGGRAWYTGLGHTKESYEEPLFVHMIDRAIAWAGGRKIR